MAIGTQIIRIHAKLAKEKQACPKPTSRKNWYAGATSKK
jgi:hypothetical protein